VCARFAVDAASQSVKRYLPAELFNNVGVLVHLFPQIDAFEQGRHACESKRKP
jgi:hypothetical protein